MIYILFIYIYITISFKYTCIYQPNDLCLMIVAHQFVMYPECVC